MKQFAYRIAAAAVLAGSAALTAGGAASAEGWNITAFDNEATTEICMANARLMYERYGRSYAIGEIAEGSWTVYGYELGGNGLDSMVICRTGTGDVEPFMVTHSADSRDDQREAVHGALRDIWNAPK